MKYIMDMEKETRDTMITRIVNISFNRKKKNSSHVLKMHEDITNCVHEKIALKQKKRRGQIKRMLRDNFEAGCYVLEGLSDCDEKKTTTILNIINMNALERRVIHVWYDSDQKLDVTWNGRIKRVVKKMISRDILLVTNYLKKNQCEEEGEEALTSIFQLAADYYCGDLCFV